MHWGGGEGLVLFFGRGAEQTQSKKMKICGWGEIINLGLLGGLLLMGFWDYVGQVFSATPGGAASIHVA